MGGRGGGSKAKGGGGRYSQAEMESAVSEYTGGDYVDIVAASAGFTGVYEMYSDAMMDDADRQAALRKADAIEQYLAKSEKYDGEVMRALGFDFGGESDGTDNFNRLMGDLQRGNEIQLGSITSWTTSPDVVSQFHAYRAGIGEDYDSIGRVTLHATSKTGVSIKNLSVSQYQDEVLFSKKAKFKVNHVSRTTDRRGNITVEAFLEEI